MDEQQQKQIAVFRFGVIADFVNRPNLERGEQQRLLREKSERRWQIPFCRHTSFPLHHCFLDQTVSEKWKQARIAPPRPAQRQGQQQGPG